MNLLEAFAELGVESTASPRDARRAYLRLLKTRKPETDPSGFMRLREAFELASAYLTHCEALHAAGAASRTPCTPVVVARHAGAERTPPPDGAFARGGDDAPASEPSPEPCPTTATDPRSSAGAATDDEPARTKPTQAPAVDAPAAVEAADASPPPEASETESPDAGPGEGAPDAPESEEAARPDAGDMDGPEAFDVEPANEALEPLREPPASESEDRALRAWFEAASRSLDELQPPLQATLRTLAALHARGETARAHALLAAADEWLRLSGGEARHLRDLTAIRWRFARELDALPAAFPKHLRGPLARAIAADIEDAAAELEAFRDYRPARAGAAARTLRDHAPTLATAFAPHLEPPLAPRRVLRPGPLPNAHDGGRPRGYAFGGMGAIVMVVVAIARFCIATRSTPHIDPSERLRNLPGGYPTYTMPRVTIPTVAVPDFELSPPLSSAGTLHPAPPAAFAAEAAGLVARMRRHPLSAVPAFADAVADLTISFEQRDDCASVRRRLHALRELTAAIEAQRKLEPPPELGALEAGVERVCAPLERADESPPPARSAAADPRPGTTAPRPGAATGPPPRAPARRPDLL